jgi:AAA ATPase domain
MASLSHRDYSPFSPGQPVPIEYFVGRREEVERLRDKVIRATNQKRVEVAFIQGERGIGKSSLASFVRHLVERDHAVIGVHVYLGGVSTLDELIRRVLDRLINESADKPWFERIREALGSRIKRVGLFGVTLEIDATAKELDRLAVEFAPALRRLLDKLAGEKKGLLIILDDINGLAASGEFAHWLKSFVDDAATARAPLPLCLALVGLEDKRAQLVKLQPSLARILDPIDMGAWSREGTRDFIGITLAKVGVSIDHDAIERLADLAGGLPMLAHELGDAAFKADSDGTIDLRDAVNGAVAAADVVGRKYLEPQVYQAIRSKAYRDILRSVAVQRAGFTRKNLVKVLPADQAKVLDNFLRKMLQLGVIARDPEGGPGSYRFVNALHALYFFIEAERAKSGPAE